MLRWSTMSKPAHRSARGFIIFNLLLLQREKNAIKALISWSLSIKVIVLKWDFMIDMSTSQEDLVYDKTSGA